MSILDNGFTRRILALLVFGVSSAALLLQIPMPDWWIVLAGSVAGFYFGLERPGSSHA